MGKRSSVRHDTMIRDMQGLHRLRESLEAKGLQTTLPAPAPKKTMPTFTIGLISGVLATAAWLWFWFH